MTGGSPRAALPGFTLLEVLVAMAIFAVVSVVAYSGLQSAIQASQRAGAASTRLAELQRGYSVLAGDFGQLAPRSIRNAFGDREPALLTEVGEVRMTRAGRANPLAATRSEFQRVGYRLSAEGELLRLAWPALDQPIDGQPSEAVVLRGVEEFNLRFLDDQQRWRDGWPGAEAEIGAEPLPRAVELTLRVDGFGELRWLFAGLR